ncbi:unnamed protein product, partial [Fasciola hepatica]
QQIIGTNRSSKFTVIIESLPPRPYPIDLEMDIFIGFDSIQGSTSFVGGKIKSRKYKLRVYQKSSRADTVKYTRRVIFRGEHKCSFCTSTAKNAPRAEVQQAHPKDPTLTLNELQEIS